MIKLGGSALTDKSRIYTPRSRVIARAARQVAVIAKRFSIVIVHGAGSYGHIPVKRLGLAHGFTNPRQLRGLAATKLKLLEWEQIFDAVFLKHNVPLIPLFASDFVVANGGRIASAELGPLKRWLRIGCVPTTGGDIVQDSKTGFSILSGDQLATHLAIRLKALKVIFAMDEDGIFDSDPKQNPKAKLLLDLTPSQASLLARTSTMSTTLDVTGGMAGKIKEAVEVASKGIPVYFVNLTKDERLRKVAFAEKVPCSKIRLN